MPNRMDKIVSKGMGEMKGVKARLGGLVDVFKTLVQQHGEASGLLMRLRHAPDRRSELWPEIKTALQAHEQGELRAVYPELSGFSELRAMADRHEAEAGQLDGLIAKVDATDMATDNFDRALDALISAIGQHVEEEEKQIFPTALRVIGDDLAKELDAKFKVAHDQVKNAH